MSSVQTEPLTLKDIEVFESQRQIYWDQLGDWWKRFWELQKSETAFRNQFRDQFGLPKSDSIEFIISEWKRLHKNVQEPEIVQKDTTGVSS